MSGKVKRKGVETMRVGLVRLLLLFVLPSVFGFLTGCQAEEEGASGKVPSPEELALAFPDGFLWGAASSAYQTEGHRVPTDFDAWLEQTGLGNGLPGDACNSYELYELDAELVRALGCNAYRLGIEWARIEPFPHEFDQREIDHYRDVVQALVDRGIKPIVTLHHFTNPFWVYENGGWANPDTLEHFLEYVSTIVPALADLVDIWITINEPVIYSMGLELLGMYPGGHLADFRGFLYVTKQMALAHGRAYQLIHQLDTTDADGDGIPALVSIAKCTQPVVPLDESNPDDVQAAALYDYYFHWLYLNAITQGWVDLNGNGVMDGEDEGPYPELEGALDFLGINYYAPARMKGFELVPYIGGFPCMYPVWFLCYPEGVDFLYGENGNEVFPDGIVAAIDYATRLGLPAMILENGIATTDSYFRSWYIIEHLKRVHAAIESGADVRGYLYWTLMDNFEWLLGYTVHFGLYRLDRSTLERKWTLACDTYREIATRNGITYGLLMRYSVPPSGAR
ncbi:MAG TPA: glycoside hydrolase family 1 protein [Proteobacteria bacterium]|nr:glycoside hydrolase family 1 protein [Pseudomonadota bacterium]